MTERSTRERARSALRHGAVVTLGLVAVVYGLRMLLAEPVGVDAAVRTVGLAAAAGLVVAARRYRAGPVGGSA